MKYQDTKNLFFDDVLCFDKNKKYLCVVAKYNRILFIDEFGDTHDIGHEGSKNCDFWKYFTNREEKFKRILYEI